MLPAQMTPLFPKSRPVQGHLWYTRSILSKPPHYCSPQGGTNSSANGRGGGFFRRSASTLMRRTVTAVRTPAPGPIRLCTKSFIEKGRRRIFQRPQLDTCAPNRPPILFTSSTGITHRGSLERHRNPRFKI